MQVTKFPQSCLLVERAGGRILIDPGTFAMDAVQPDAFGPVDAVLYTHRHPDHLDERFVGDWLERGAVLYGNADVCELLGPGRATEVRDGEAFEVAGFGAVPHDLPHVEGVDGTPGPPNTGYLIDGRLFHPGDGMALEGLSVEVLAAPIAGPSISFRDTYRFVAAVAPRRVVPVHYDFFRADPELFARFCDLAEVVVLGNGETLELG